MQITSGLISCDPNVDNSAVTGNASVDWSQVTTNCILIVGGVMYGITSVDPVLKILTISPAWVGVALSNVAYVIVRDFTSILQLPLLNPGDLEAAAIFSRAMRQLDGLGAGVTTDPTVSDYLIEATAHNFIVGNALYLSGTTWFKCLSTSTTASRIVGMVSRVVDANHFWIRFSGSVGGTYPISVPTLVPGTVYYLRAALAGDGSNIGIEADAGSTKIPIAQAASANSVYLLNFARAESSTFTETQPGLVPAHNSPAVTKLLFSTGWGDAAGLTDASIKAQHLSPTPALAGALATTPEWAGFQARTAGVAIHPFIMDLQTRLKTAEATVVSSGVTSQVYTRKTQLLANGDWSWTPNGAAYARVTLFCGEAMGNGTLVIVDPTDHTKGWNMPIASGVRFRMNLTGVTSLSGLIKPYFTSFYVNSVEKCSIGWSAETELKAHWNSPKTTPIPYLMSLLVPSQATSIVRLREHLVSYHHPEYSATDVAMVPRLALSVPIAAAMAAVNDKTKYYYHSGGAPGSFSGVVIIETGIGV